MASDYETQDATETLTIEGLSAIALAPINCTSRRRDTGTAISQNCTQRKHCFFPTLSGSRRPSQRTPRCCDGRDSG
ncbi:hypothetical protein [Coleofasciculus sp. E2-BRE-01]|uniref:hypothetical protein n=1 Tax=Coleofasciculus sp. E2-BRE-01 TaxID=3069524 RepID=UPI0033045698